ncbi:MAG TPA: hypothetical protein VK589_18605 [Chryseolinea sp.]|nr:hypothetical protein [Chryseolinea sp.]
MKFAVVVFMLVLSTIGYLQQSKPIVVQNAYFPKAGKEKEVYEWRLHASDVREKLGLPKGRVLRRISVPTTIGSNGSYVIWECEYSSMEERQRDVEKLDQSEEFKKVQEHMTTLLDKFERTVWEVN